jgi:thiamine transport system ATP-binding protein
MLELKQVSYQYSDQVVFDFSLTLNQGDSLAIIGPSGSGKSTLLDIISGFIIPNSGKIIFNQVDVTNLPANERPINAIFQKNNLFPHLNVFDNIAIGISPNLKITSIQRDIIEQSLEKVNLNDFNRRFPGQLSSGQAQRVALARTLVRNKPILLLDEPFSSLDSPLRIEMLDLVKSLQQEQSFIMIMVTHNYNDAIRICNKTCFVNNGKIVSLATTKQFSETKDPLIRRYI